MDRIYSFTEVIMTEKDGVCLVVEGECANSDIIGWTGGGETEESGCLGGGKDEDVAPWVMFGVSRVSKTESFDFTETTGIGKVKVEYRDRGGNIKCANMRVVHRMSWVLPSDCVRR